MKQVLTSITTLLILPLGSLNAADAGDHLSPHQRAILESKSPPPAEYRFSFDLPAGPQFTESEKEALRELGKGVRSELVGRAVRLVSAASAAFFACRGNFFRQMKPRDGRC